MIRTWEEAYTLICSLNDKGSIYTTLHTEQHHIWSCMQQCADANKAQSGGNSVAMQQDGLQTEAHSGQPSNSILGRSCAEAISGCRQSVISKNVSDSCNEINNGDDDHVHALHLPQCITIGSITTARLSSHVGTPPSILKQK